MNKLLIIILFLFITYFTLEIVSVLGDSIHDKFNSLLGAL